MNSSGTSASRREFEEAVPGLGTAREDYVSGLWVLPDEDLTALKAKIGGQAHGLAAAIGKKLCGARHEGLLRNWYISEYITCKLIILHDVRLQNQYAMRPSIAPPR